MNLDQNGLVLSGGDAGDSCQRTYSVRLCLQDSINPPVVFSTIPDGPTLQKLFQPTPGIYVRSPDLTFWGSDPRNLSRDQMTPVICYLAVRCNRGSEQDKVYYRSELSALLKQCVKRKMFSQNIYPNWVDPRKVFVTKKTPDFINFDLWGIFARGWIYTWWAPVAFMFIIFGDIFSILSSMFKVWAPINKDGTLKFRIPGPDDVDDLNGNNCFIAQMAVFPTPLSWLARKIYKWFRRANFGNTTLGEKSHIMGAIAYYNRNDNPEITEIYRPLVEKY